MKFDKNLLQRATDSFVVHARELSSRGSSFLILMLGMLLQASHTTLLMYHVSAFESNIIKGLVAFGIGIFVSGALAIFTLKSDGKNKEINHIINVFFYFEVFTNIFYYWNSLIFIPGFENATTQNWLYLIIAMPFSYIMPFTIKKFAGAIRSDESLDFGNIDVIPTDNDEEMKEQEVIELFNKMFEEKLETLNLDKKSELDLEQLEKQLDEKLKDPNTFKDFVKRNEKIKVKVNDKEGELEII